MGFVSLIREADSRVLEIEVRKYPDIVNEPDEQGVTPLLAAIASGRKEIVEFLLKCGADPNYNASESPLPLTFAVDTALEEEDYDWSRQEIPTDVLAMLVNYGATIYKIDITEGVTPLEYAQGRSFSIEDFFKKIDERQNRA